MLRARIALLLSAAMSIRPALPSEHALIREMLADNDLPVQDLDAAEVAFFVADAGGTAAGVVGLQTFGQTGLLRSLAVRAEHRGGGLGGRLVAEAEREARARGLAQLVLLTQTAADYFASRGYRRIERAQAPVAVQASAEFSSLCPASAACLSKSLLGSTDARGYNVLFLCTGNSARSQMAEALLNAMGQGRVRAYSAGSRPAPSVQPLAARLIADLGLPTDALRPKSWDEFAGPEAPAMDIVITVCDNAAGEACPLWPGHPAIAHWGVADPALTPDDPQAFKRAWLTLRRRIELLLALPLDKLDRLAREQHLQRIGQAL